MFDSRYREVSVGLRRRGGGEERGPSHQTLLNKTADERSSPNPRGAGWLAYALHRMDFEFEDRFRDLMKLKPSEYWRRQWKATFQFDPISAKLIEEMGVETMMWGSDYLHTDGIWPESSKYIKEQFAGLSPEWSTKSPARTPPNSTIS
jgi:uncharacterized protein